MDRSGGSGGGGSRSGSGGVLSGSGSYGSLSAGGGNARPVTTQSNPLVASKKQRCCSPDYFRSPLGVLKVLETALSVVALICALIQLDAVGGWGTFVAGCSLVACLLLLLMHGTGLVSRLHFNVPFTEFLIAIIHFTLFLISSIVCAAYGLVPQYAAYAFFGFAACLSYAVDAVMQSRTVRSGGSGFRCLPQPSQSTQQLPQPPPAEKY